MFIVTFLCRWIGFGLICMGLGSMVWTLPHFSTPVYTVSGDTGGSGGHETSLCHTDNNTNTCHNDDTSTRTSLAAYRYSKHEIKSKKLNKAFSI